MSGVRGVGVLQRPAPASAKSSLGGSKKGAGGDGEEDEDASGEGGGWDPHFKPAAASATAARFANQVALTPLQLLEKAALERAAAETGPSGGTSALLSADSLDTLSELPLRVDARGTCGRFSPGGRFWAVGCADGSVRVCKTDIGREAHVFIPKVPSNAVRPAVTALRFRPAAAGEVQNVLAITSTDGQVTHWHCTSGKTVGEPISTKDTYAVSVDYDSEGARFATGGEDGRVRLYDGATHALLSTLAADPAKSSTQGHTDRVFSLKFPEDPHLLVSGGWDSVVFVWDVRTGVAERRLEGPYLCGDALDAAGSTLFTGSWRGTEQLQAWDLGSAQLVHTVPFFAPKGEEPCALYSVSLGRLKGVERLVAAGGSGSNEVRLVDRETGRPRARLPRLASGVNAVQFSPGDAKTLGIVCSHASLLVKL